MTYTKYCGRVLANIRARARKTGKEDSMIKSDVSFESATGKLTGENVSKVVRKLSDIKNIFKDKNAIENMDLAQIVYQVEMHSAVEEGKSGGLFFGTSYLHPGKVGDEYFMTKGHFHLNIDTAEYYWCIKGKGALILMSEDGKTEVLEMKEGSLHYIPGKVAHRLCNTGDEILVVGACWPSDAGHDYASIEKSGFSGRLIERDGNPTFVES